MNSELEDLLVDPETKEALARASDAQLEAIRRALRDKRARRHDGGELPDDVAGAYVSHGGRWVYADAQGFASFLIEERIELDERL